MTVPTKATEILEGAKPPIIYFTGAGAPPCPPFSAAPDCCHVTIYPIVVINTIVS